MASFIKLFWGIIYATISGFDSGYAAKNVSYDKKVLWNCPEWIDTYIVIFQNLRSWRHNLSQNIKHNADRGANYD